MCCHYYYIILVPPPPPDCIHVRRFCSFSFGFPALYFLTPNLSEPGYLTVHDYSTAREVMYSVFMFWFATLTWNIWVIVFHVVHVPCCPSVFHYGVHHLLSLSLFLLPPPPPPPFAWLSVVVYACNSADCSITTTSTTTTAPPPQSSLPTVMTTSCNSMSCLYRSDCCVI